MSRSSVARPTMAMLAIGVVGIGAPVIASAATHAATKPPKSCPSLAVMSKTAGTKLHQREQLKSTRGLVCSYNNATARSAQTVSIEAVVTTANGLTKKDFWMEEKQLAAEEKTTLHSFKAGEAAAWLLDGRTVDDRPEIEATVLVGKQLVGVDDNQASKHVIAIAKKFS
jgi:hypothetical protein